MAGIYSLLCVIIATAFTHGVNAVDYCNVKSCGRSHTVCMFPSPIPSPKCAQWTISGLSAAEKAAVVNKHNELRRRVASGQETRGNPGPQPAAVRMPDLSWDSELELVAQRWANQCNFAHDTCRNVDRFAVGQNIAKTMHSGENTSTVQSMIQLWYDEVDYFDRNLVHSYQFDPATGHYTQIVWADTTKIGCGRIKYQENGWNVHYLVCNYGKSGNWIGERIYEAKY
ncbi:PREDICTED: venom allergen 3-like [Vollenhovia emeryi]|uniref:venom allergen 3-like n=1 Tax=Vollenhovia emeryi TaxID=411798 RepID=UPI0005F3BF6D|nr:PREDICTED: venom allergen 3-like [Vollenhovia emeryi]